ncbi:MAG: MerR family transcriptional regulator [Acidimicrobiia bacterium]|nr:MerR family transcriptional regulator [Acidimicrobiia bacterium]
MAEPGATHLSIGEVLGLLLEEFPDVTISKIRFLESQGLIAPERTASGYRKFCAEDVELLRVILREQRENFLPLRVIRDRLDSGAIDTSGDATPVRGDERPSDAVVANHPAASRAASTDAAPGRTAGGGAGAAPTLLPGVLVNRQELCAMASISPDDLARLEDFGVVTPRPGVGDLFGDEAVEIAAAAGGFLRLGVDARHLRSWRTSVEREAGLFEQLIVPLLRQRNPQARTQAIEQLGQLNALSGRLRSALMRSTLRQYTTP